MLNGEEEGVLRCVVGVEVLLPNRMVYCGLGNPHRSVGGDQVTLTTPRVDTGANENMIGAPTAARNSREQLKTHKHMYNYSVFLPFLPCHTFS